MESIFPCYIVVDDRSIVYDDTEALVYGTREAAQNVADNLSSTTVIELRDSGELAFFFGLPD